MAFSDFLFSGSPPPVTTSTETNTAGLPLWYSQYAQALTNQASAIAGEPFQTYGGARIADFAPAQQQAFQHVTQNANAWQPQMQQATDVAQMGAQPFSQSGLQQFMSPYMSGVTDEISRLGWQDFERNAASNLRSEFVGAGQFGSERHMDQFGRSMADTQREILGAQSGALQSGFNQAMQNYGNWQDRYMEAGKGLGSLAEQRQALDMRTGAALEAVGAQQQGLDQRNLDLAYKDFVEQRDYPRTNVSFLNEALRGMQPMPASTTQTTSAPFSGQMSPSPLAQLASAYGAFRGLGNQNTAT